MRKRWIILFIMLCISACSPLGSGENVEKSTTNNDEEKAVTEVENEDEDEGNDAEEEEPPESVVFTSKLPKSYVTTSDIDVSEVEKEIIDTLNEFKAEEIDDDTMLTLPEDILFDFDSDKLRSDADDAIEKLMQIMDATDGDVKIVGHTDSKGEDDYNQKLSEKRADAVVDALVDKGGEKDRLTAEGKGASDPVAKNTNSDGSDNPEGRQKNRRVEVIVHGFNQ